MWNSKVAGAPLEYFTTYQLKNFAERWGYFNEHTQGFELSITRYIDKLKRYRTTSNGVFGLKAHYSQFFAFIHHYATDNTAIEAFTSIIEQAKFIYLYRQDRLRQAISYLKALQTGQWSSEQPILAAARYNYTAEEEGWERFFNENKLHPLKITYEHFIQAQPETLLTILAFIGIDTQDIKISCSTMKKQANQENEKWVTAYYQGLDNLIE